MWCVDWLAIQVWIFILHLCSVYVSSWRFISNFCCHNHDLDSCLGLESIVVQGEGAHKVGFPLALPQPCYLASFFSSVQSPSQSLESPLDIIKGFRNMEELLRNWEVGRTCCMSFFSHNCRIQTLVQSYAASLLKFAKTPTPTPTHKHHLVRSKAG